MNIETARKAAELLEEKGELEYTLERLLKGSTLGLSKGSDFHVSEYYFALSHQKLLKERVKLAINERIAELDSQIAEL